MADLCEQIKTAIRAEYDTLAAFAQETGIPYSTLSSIVKNGMDNSKFAVVMKICRCLKIDAFENEKLNFTDKDINFLLKFSHIDKYAAELVEGIVDYEYKRSNKF